MPIGKSYFMVSNNRAARLFHMAFGTPDLHTHIRLRPIVGFFKKYIHENSGRAIEILEPGCGNGVNAFEIEKIFGRSVGEVHYTGVDIDVNAINTAGNLCRRLGKDNMLTFRCEDAVEFLKNPDTPFADIILLSDIVEHVGKPEELISAAYRRLKNGGLLVVSVPTLLYSRFFGRKFHDRIGHMIDGYTLETLDGLFVRGFKCRRIFYRYNTGLISNAACWLYYNVLDTKNKWLLYIKSIILYPFIFMDFYNSSRVSCTLFAVYRKGPDER